MSESLSVTRALTELKLLDKRIHAKLKVDFIGLTQKREGNKILNTTKTVQEFEADAKSQYEAVTALIARRQRIKAALIKSNALTTVKIKDLEMTVAEAIDFKTAIKYEKDLLTHFRQGRTWALNTMERHQQSLDNQVNEMLTKNLGAEKKTSDKDYDAIAGPFVDANKFNIVDPLNSDKIIKEMEEKIDSFEAEVDMALAESNAKTDLTI